MAYILDLSAARGKVARADLHIDRLRAEILEAGQAENKRVPIRRQYEPNEGAIVARLYGVVEISNNWSYILGDAIHNLRAALDYLTWQLALKYFNGVESEAEKVAPSIQFPIIEDPKYINDPKLWAGHRNRQYMDAADAAIIEYYQPFEFARAGHPPNVVYPLTVLARLSNTDKHRKINVTYIRPQRLAIANVAERGWIDCVPVLGPNGRAQVFMRDLGDSPQPGDEILRIPVNVTGPNPDVNLDITLTGYVGVNELDLLDALAEVRTQVVKILDRF